MVSTLVLVAGLRRLLHFLAVLRESAGQISIHIHINAGNARPECWPGLAWRG